jgi:hypothetical protein
MRGGEGRALVEAHGDVGIEQVLDLHAARGRQAMVAAVDMAAEGHAIRVHLPKAREAHHLEPAGIGQDGSVPVHHPVQPAEPRDALGARAQHQVIGIAEHHPRAGGAHGIRRHRLHRARGADRHEHRRRHLAMRRHQRARARGAIGGGELPMQRHAPSSPGMSRSQRNSRLPSP